MRTISNQSRGCGKLKRGGCYLQGRRGPGGLLSTWSWVLGEPWFGGINLYTDNPSRAMVVFNGAASLLDDEIVMPLYSTEASDFSHQQREHLAKIPARCLLDHVGAAYYTPWGFAEETRSQGASRKVTPHFAAMIAEVGTPVPIFFTHKIPVCETSERAVAYHGALTVKPDGPVPVPTWHEPQWGIVSGDGRGDHHPWVEVLRLLDTEPQYKESSAAALEMIFGVSWITDVIYVAHEGETVLPDHLQGSRVEIVGLEEAE